MKVTQSTANLLQVTKLGLINCYLVREDDGFTLVDTGIPGEAGGILAAAAAAGAPVKRLLLTHAHSDHVGSVNALIERLPGVGVAISERDARLLRKDLSLDADEPQTKIRGGVPGTKTQPSQFVTEGDLVGSLRCLSTPGHTPGHFSFLDERDGTLLAGDALVTVGGKLHTSADAPWYFPLPTLATWHKPTAIASVARLLQAPRAIARVAPGHGAVLEIGRAELAAAAERAKGA